ncbi:hypothetical protein [Streptomyces sp. DH24]|uniref:hypothetical protein n=1 Tax=Streptomyces sp. DH24 TaxID=3040123 RepID=UPI002441E91C|nr:hypothetical protein [Streptomyces sp. DH24]MDG9716409.1 hypothetical protein [Streptomyces sp. DH24]
MPRGTGPGGPLRRVRTVLLDPVTGNVAVDEHVRARLTAGEEDRALLGDVLVEYGTGAPRAAEVAVAHPGALVVAVHQGARCWIRLSPDGTVLELEAGGGPAPHEELWEGVASLAHSWLAAGRSGAALRHVCLFLVHVPHPPPSSRVSRCRAASASSDRDLPTEE